MESLVVTRPRPRFAVGVAALLLCAIAAATASARPTISHARAGSLVALPSLSAEVAAAVNRVRREHGRRALSPAVGLEAAALRHTVEMGTDGYFSHDSGDGTWFWKRLRAFYPEGASRCWSVGENLVYASPELTAEQAVQLWMSSPEHRRNLLDPRWRQMGIAAVHVIEAGGVYGGQTVTLITNDFGARSC
jgi:uncharacterized protein YkwD